MMRSERCHPHTSTSSSRAQASLATVYRYHDGTKHHFHAFARSLGYLDWASQPRPFRGFVGAPAFPLYPTPGVAADGYAPSRAGFDRACALELSAEPVSAPALGDMLRHALGLSAWKRFGSSRWSLRVNPSSGNLHRRLRRQPADVRSVVLSSLVLGDGHGGTGALS